MFKPQVFFFRGLSTYSSDHAKMSIFDFGPMFKNLAVAFAARDIDFHPILGMGSGSLLEVANRARGFLRKHPVWNDPTTPVHLLGHSTGGLVARLLADGARAGGLRSCLTIASPNHGSRLAQICMDMPETHPGSARLLRALGYNVAAKRGFFREITAAHVEKVFGERPIAVAERTASIVCQLPRREFCLPLKVFCQLPAFNEFDLPSDGVVESVSQPFGQVIAELAIDHFRQIGIFGEPERFQIMCDVAADFFKQK